MGREFLVSGLASYSITTTLLEVLSLEKKKKGRPKILPASIGASETAAVSPQAQQQECSEWLARRRFEDPWMCASVWRPLGSQLRLPFVGWLAGNFSLAAPIAGLSLLNRPIWNILSTANTQWVSQRYSRHRLHLFSQSILQDWHGNCCHGNR